jgi:hypothetical protein
MAGERERRFFEFSETQEFYKRKPLLLQLEDLMKQQIDLKKLTLSADDFLHKDSWFTILWTCQRVQPINKNGLASQCHEDASVSSL